MPRWSQASRSVQRRTRKENSFLLFSKSAIYRTCWLPPSEYCPFAPTYTSTYTPAHPFPVCPCVFRGYFFQWVGVACVGHSFTAHLFFKELYVFLVITQPQFSITTPSPPPCARLRQRVARQQQSSAMSSLQRKRKQHSRLQKQPTAQSTCAAPTQVRGTG